MRKYLFIAVALLLIPLYTFIQYKRNPYFVINGFTQGTTYRILYKPGYNLAYSFNVRRVYYDGEISAKLAELDASLSTYDPGSIVSRINNNQHDVMVDDHFLKVYNRAAEITELTGGSFDITVGPLVNAWGFGPGPKLELDSSKVDSLLELVGMEKVELEDRHLTKESQGIFLDFNAIAQGYSVDVIAGFLESKRIKNYLVEIGGEIRTMGTKRNQEPWILGVDRPAENNVLPGEDLQTTLTVTDISLATSGNYRKFYEEDGQKFVHSINPLTGYPVRHQLLSVTITAEDCMTADALATACMVMGFDKSKNLVEGLEGVEAYFIYSNVEGEFEVYVTEGFAKLLKE